MSTRLSVKTAYANVYSEPTFTSQLVTQALFFESLEIISEHDNWYKISQWDGYSGYVHRFYLSESHSSLNKNYTVLDRFQSLYASPSLDNLAMVVPFGSDIPVEDTADGWLRTAVINEAEFFLKPEPRNSNMSKRESIISFSGNLVGAPYLWGGKTPFGYDCSGFVQSIYKSVGIDIKRDTSLQMSDKRMSTIELSSSIKGDLVFFNIDGDGVDHVGIIYDQDNLIHCGGEVKKQSFDDDSHVKLSDCVLEVKSVGNLLDE
jgi:hypothetical protein